jgi:hypothetical protein
VADIEVGGRREISTEPIYYSSQFRVIYREKVMFFGRLGMMKQELLRADCCIPAPSMSETDRQKMIEGYRLGIWARRCIIEKEWRVRNLVFDQKGEKTTTMLRIRPVKTEDELEFIVAKLEEAMEKGEYEQDIN